MWLKIHTGSKSFLKFYHILDKISFSLQNVLSRPKTDTVIWPFNRKMSGKSVFFINNHMPLLGYRISIISIRYPTIPFDFKNWQSENVDLSICRLSMTSLKITMNCFLVRSICLAFAGYFLLTDIFQIYVLSSCSEPAEGRRSVAALTV